MTMRLKQAGFTDCLSLGHPGCKLMSVKLEGQSYQKTRPRLRNSGRGFRNSSDYLAELHELELLIRLHCRKYPALMNAIPLTGVHVDFRLAGKHNRRADWDNTCGIYLDALKNAGVLVGDNLAHVQSLSLRLDHSTESPCTSVTIKCGGYDLTSIPTLAEPALAVDLDGDLARVKAKPRPRFSRITNTTFMPPDYIRWRNSVSVWICTESRRLNFEPLGSTHVRIILTGKHNRRADADNLAGGLMDALTASTLISDDNLKQVPSGEIFFIPSNQPASARIELHDSISLPKED